MKQTARQTEAYDLAKGTLGREGEVGRLASQAQSIVPTILKCSTAARGTLACTTSTIAHVNATHPRPELDVVSVLSKNLSPVCGTHLFRALGQGGTQQFRCFGMISSGS